MRVLDANGLAADYRAEVAKAIPRKVVVPDEFWRQLEEAIRFYDAMQRTRRQRSPAQDARQRFTRIAKLSAELRRELFAARHLIAPADPTWPMDELVMLTRLGDRAHAAAEGHGDLSRAFAGRQDPHRDFLYADVCKLWASLGGYLRYARPAKGGAPYGPAITFLTVVLGPILGDDMPTTHGLAKMLDRQTRPPNDTLTR
jgi:hypothetical protein